MNRAVAMMSILALITGHAIADTGWNNSYIYMWDGSSDTYYDLNGADQAENFDGADLGTFSPGYTLFLNAEINAFANGGDTFTWFVLASSVNGMPFLWDTSDSIDNIGGDNYRGLATGTDLSGYAPGTYTLDVYLARSHTWSGGGQYTTYLNTTGDIGGAVDPGSTPPSGDFFSATFTVVPEPATMALFGMGLAGLMVARRRRA